MIKSTALLAVATLVALSLFYMVDKAKGYTTQHLYELARIEREACEGKE